MELQGFYNEQVLNELLYDGKITQLEYIYHHSEERIAEYEEYCERRKLPENEDSADAFTKYLLKREEYSHTEGMD